MLTGEVRAAFLDFFRQRGHQVVSSSSLVPSGDPSLLFANAGMNQFKDVFTGIARPSYDCAASAQKCVRAGGKHNDLDNVGYTARHLTFFEMLGNFAFGAYFKEQAIRLAWELLVDGYRLPPERLLCTVFAGDEELNLPPDDEAYRLWRRVGGIADDRIIALGARDNFWQMGEAGPCGPCSEIIFDQHEQVRCAEEKAGRVCLGVACECDRFLELWNLVFMQFVRRPDGTLAALPTPAVDTGMGLERLTAVLQQKRSNFEIDAFTPLIAEVESICRRQFDPTDYTGASASMRVVADHARTTAFLMADGIVPARTGRAYVLRRIMRRAIYHGWLLDIDQLFLHRIVDAVIDTVSEVYPELAQQRTPTLEMTRLEEERFRRTLARGASLLEKELGSLSAEAQLPGAVAFRLYDTCGFPLDLMQLIAEARGVSVDVQAFEHEMEGQRARSTFGGAQAAGAASAPADMLRDLPATEFVGYGRTESEARVLRLLVDGERVERVAAGTAFALVCDRTPFYGERGGQVGDSGWVTAPGAQIGVRDARWAGDVVVHAAELEQGELAAGETIRLAVDADRRAAICRSHSATHLLHWALRAVLGDHVAQRGSVVSCDRLRLDFSHGRPLSREELGRVEELVNRCVMRNLAVDTAISPLAEARRSGALALFGENYGESVRVVSIDESRELCAGTHVRASGDIGLIKVVNESGVAHGVRRIAALSGGRALDHVRQLELELSSIADQLRVSRLDILSGVDRLRSENRALAARVAELEVSLRDATASDPLAGLEVVAGIKVVAAQCDVTDPRSLRELGDRVRRRLGSGILLLAGVGAGERRVDLVCMVTSDLTDRVSASDLIREIAPLVQGRGGGRADIARAGGSDPAGIDAALARARELITAAVAVGPEPRERTPPPV